jgi:transcriptional regulator with PAS, ATPase and Fis domain
MPKNEHSEHSFADIVGQAAAMQEVFRMVRLAAPRSTNVLLIGETGTGKEVFAKAIHKLSKRSDGPYIRVNCGALHENLLESELFGHIKGAFTGAIDNKTGRFEAAHGGSIFLDEINSMSPKLQVKLLRVLQEREFERVGETKTIRVNVRVIAATNASLEELVAQGHFREDLYYRLNVVPIVLPPLRERREDILDLARFFINRSAEQNQLFPTPELTPEICKALLAHDWPGNVRELENTMERLVVLSEDGKLSADLLRLEKPKIFLRSAKQSNGNIPHDVPSLIKTLVKLGLQTPLPPGKKLADFLVGGLERALIEEVMRQTNQVKVNAADRLGINRNTLHKKLEEYEQDDQRDALPPEPGEASI